ncbi:MAG: AAA family ATPase [Parachlamydia sp.]|nr:AAA family ATPase [Parachlamydia sp.]
MDQGLLAKLLDDFYSLFPENHKKICYLFLDEIHNVDGWALVIRRYLNTKNVRIYLSGSSAKLLSTEIATSLRGRSLSLEVWPYSFAEYLRFKQLPELKKTLSRIERDGFSKTLDEYLAEGGSLKLWENLKCNGCVCDVSGYRRASQRH